MLKFSEKFWNLFAITSKLLKFWYLFLYDWFYRSLGIYNCDKDHRAVEKSDIKKFFSLF